VLHASLGVRVGKLDLALDLEVADGEVVALLGPNGAGKSTALRAVAGLQPLDSGRVEVDGAVLDDPAAGVFVPVAERSIGLVFQDYLLFPRMSARDNVAFGLRARGVGKAEARRRAGEWLDRLGLAAHADARPAALSGGQAQRVALARALATGPRLLLLDEPLAALDARARIQVRAELRRHLATFPGARLLVTHDPLDALVLADRMVVLDGGRVTQQGPPAEVARRPRTRYVADLVGVNLVHGRRTGPHTVTTDTGATLTVADRPPPEDALGPGDGPADGPGDRPGGEVAVAVRPQAVALHLAEPHGSPRNAWPATVAEVEPDRDRVRVRLDGPLPVTAEVTPAAVAELGLVPGARVWATIKATELDVYPR
jgi:molybdate transport system ATP-binding protein